MAAKRNAPPDLAGTVTSAPTENGQSTRFDPPVKVIVTFSQELEYTLEGVIGIGKMGSYLVCNHISGGMTFITDKHLMIQVEGPNGSV